MKQAQKCVACRLNCKDLNVFSKCNEKYYYYGGRQKEPCYNRKNVDETVIQTAIGICIEKNSCKLKKVNAINPQQYLQIYMQTVSQSPYSPEDY